VNRLAILKEITNLTETHCRRCEVTEMINLRKGTMRVCIDECHIGKEFQKLGEMLAPRKKPKFSPRDNPIRKSHKHITKEILERELATEKTYAEIEKDLALPCNYLEKFIKRHGIAGRGRGGGGRLRKVKPVKVADKYAHITKEMFQTELDSGKKYRDIEKNLGIGKQCIKYLFAKFGMEGRFGANYQSISSAGVHQTGDS
jgi:transposase